MDTIYIAKSSFYDTDLSFEICAGRNKKKVIKRAVSILSEHHKSIPFNPAWFGTKPKKITSHFVVVLEVDLVN